jgi:hypothetical protein
MKSSCLRLVNAEARGISHRTVAIATTKVALFEHWTISSSSWIIFLIRETDKDLASGYYTDIKGTLDVLGREL